MALTIVESNSYASGGSNNRMDIHREVTITAAAAADVADGSTITAVALNLVKVVAPTTISNAAGQAIDLVPKFDGTGYLTFKKGTFTPTDLIFKGKVVGR